MRRDIPAREAPRPVVVCFPFLGDRVGGSHISALKLIQALDHERFAPVVAVHVPAGPAERLFKEHGVPVEMAPFHPEPGRGPWRTLAGGLARAGALTAFLRRRGVGIVHTNDGRSHGVWALPARLAGARLVWHHRAGPDAIGFRFVAPWVAHGIIAVSRFAASPPGARSLAARCTVVHSPFDTGIAELDRTACHAAACAELGVGPETRLLGFFGTLVDRKRPITFVEAVAALRREAPGLPVLGLLLGDARDRLDEAAPRRARELGIEDAIRVMGFRYPPEPWLAACDALLVPSVNEPFGRTLIEAMLLGTPVVAADSGGNAEAIEHRRTGLLVPVDDPAALARATLELLEQPALRSAIVENAGEDARGRFGVARHTEAVMAVYDRVLAAA